MVDLGEVGCVRTSHQLPSVPLFVLPASLTTLNLQRRETLAPPPTALNDTNIAANSAQPH